MKESFFVKALTVFGFVTASGYILINVLYNCKGYWETRMFG